MGKAGQSGWRFRVVEPAACDFLVAGSAKRSQWPRLIRWRGMNPWGNGRSRLGGAELHHHAASLAEWEARSGIQFTEDVTDIACCGRR